jgi:hypothetical protein
MKVKCIENTGLGFSEYTLENMGCSRNTKLPLKVGETYVVYGQMISKGILKYLVVGTYENMPTWYPAELFEVVNSQVHFEWYYKYNKEAEISAIWGYVELVEDKDYLYDLIEREEEAISIFLKRKKEIEEFCE